MQTPQKSSDQKAPGAEKGSTKKGAARSSAAPKAPAAKAKASKAPANIGVRIVTLAGNLITEVTAQQSTIVQHLLDEAKAAIVKGQGKDDGRIMHLQCNGQVLAPHWHLGDAGVDDGAVLAVIFEGAPLKLSTVDRCFSHMQANATASRLESELAEHDSAVAAAQKKREKAAADAATINEQLEQLQQRARSAQTALARADGVLRTAEAKRSLVCGELERAKQDQRTDYDRILERMKSEALRPTVVQAMRDLCLLAEAGHISDNDLVSAAEAIVALHIPALYDGAIVFLVSPMLAKKASTCQASTPATFDTPGLDASDAQLSGSISPGRLGALKVLSAAYVRSSPVATGHPSVNWTALASAVCESGDAASADLLVEGASVLVAADAGHPGAKARIFIDTFIPMLRWLRSASLAASSRLQSAMGAELSRGSIFGPAQGPRWVLGQPGSAARLAASIGEAEDPVLAMSLAEGMISRSRAGRLGDAAGATSCPLLQIMSPAWEKFRALKFVAADILHAELKTQLEAAVSEPAPPAPSCAMPEEAAAVGLRGDPRLHEFLLSPTQTEITLNLSKAGRMAVHRLIDGLDWRMSQKLSHESSGYGHGRALVVRKRHVDRARSDLEAWKQRRDARRQLLEKVRAAALVAA